MTERIGVLPEACEVCLWSSSMPGDDGRADGDGSPQGLFAVWEPLSRC